MDTSAIVEQAKQFLIIYGPAAIKASVVLLIGRIVAGWGRKASRKAMERAEFDRTLTPFLAKAVYYMVLVFAAIAALGFLGVKTTSMVAVLGAAGLAVGLALQGTLSNFAAGIMLLFFRPFNVGDYVQAGGTEGSVLEIGLFATTVKTGDNIKRIVPNSEVWGGNITNYNGFPTRRIDLVIGVSYDDDLGKVIETITEIVTADDRVLAEPALTVAVSNLGDSSVDLVVRPWCNTPDYWSLRFDLTRALKEGIEASGASFPYPQRDVHLHQIS